MDSLAPIIQGFWLESSSLDPSQPGGAYLSAAIRFSDDLSGLSVFSYDSIRISFRSSSSGQTRSLYLSTYDLQGSTLAGTFYASRKLDPFTPAGSWSLDSIQLRDQAGNSLYKSSSSSDWTTFLSSSGIIQTSFQIAYGSNPAAGTGPDSLAPSIEGFSLDSTSLDPSQPGGAYLSAALRVSDNLSGFNSGYIYFRSPSSGQLHSISLSLDNLQGSTLAGTLYASRKLYPAMTAGSWELDSILLGDKAGNSLYMASTFPDWSTFLSASGLRQTSFQVVYGSNPAPGTGPDSLAPSIQGFSLVSSSLDPSQPGGALLSGRLSFKDNVSGFDRGYVEFSSDSGQSINLFFGYPAGGGHIISGTELSGVAFASAQLKATAAAGIWRLSSVWLSDKAGNSLYKTSRYSSDWNSFLSSSGITQSSFQVAYGPNPPPGTGPDSLAPTIQGFSLDSSSLDPSQPGGAFLSGRLSFKDNVSGFDKGSLSFSSDSGQVTGLDFGYWKQINIISGSELSGVAFASSQLAATAAAGTWRLTSIYLSDKANNSFSISSSSSDWATFLSSSGITQTSFDVVYGGSPTTPVISLAVAPASVPEDGNADLIYTFTRTGSTASSLTVNYSIAGTADASDYSGATPGTGKTITFAEGSTTATLAIDPAADSTVEPDETVALTLQSGSNYTIGPSASATGTIRNDDAPAPLYTTLTTIRSLVFQKAALNNHYSVVINGLVKPITIQGNPVYEGIYSGWQTLAAATVDGTNTVLWLNPAANRLHTWTTDANWSWLSSQGWIDPNSGEGYRLEAQFNLDLNKDSIIGTPYRTIATVGSVVFQKAAPNNRYSVAIDGLVKPITIQGNPVYEGIYSGWQTLAAATVDGTNTVLWLNPAANRLHTWTTDANWSWLSSQGWIDPNSGEGYRLEAQFNLDLNKDSIIGTPYRTIATVGSVVFQKAAPNNHYSVAINGLVKPITIQGNPVYEGIYSGWQTLAAATVDGTNTVLWLNPAANRLHTWTTDANWSWLSSQGWIDPNSSEGYRLESQFNLDLNKDSIIGTPYSTIATVGSVVFQKAAPNNHYSVAIDGLVKPITIEGNPVYEGIYSGWQTLAAATVDGTNTVLWLNPAANRLHTWTTDANWSWLSSQGWIDPNSEEGYKLESQFILDLNKDSIIGTPYSTIATVGSVVFQKAVGSNHYSVAIDGLVKPITIEGNPVYEGIYSGWQTLAAATVDGTNTVLWLNPAANRLHTWTTDANWSWLSSQGWIDPNSSEGYRLESQFNLDLNKDSIIGTPYSTIATVGSVVFQKAAPSNHYSVAIDGLVKPITIEGNPVYEGIYSGWQTLAAATVDGTNTVLWLNPAANRLHTWTTDANWSWLSSQGWIDPNSGEGYRLESDFSIDLNHDSIIGIPLPTLDYLVSRIVLADPAANAAQGFLSPLAGTSGADNITATSSNQLLTGYDLVTGIAGVATQAGQIDVLDGAFAFAKTFLVAGYTRQPYANDGDQGFTLIKNFRLGSDDLVLDKAQPYVFASRSVQAYGDTVSGLGVHLDSNRNGLYDASDNLIALLAYGTANSAAGGNMAYGTSAFTGRLILI